MSLILITNNISTINYTIKFNMYITELQKLENTRKITMWSMNS